MRATRQTATPAVTVLRQPIMHTDRSVLGYAVQVVVVGGAPADGDRLVDARYATLDLAALGGGDTVFVRATAQMLLGDELPATPPGGLVLEVPRAFADRPDAVGHVARLRATGAVLALADYRPDADRDALLPLVDFAKVDLGQGEQAAALAVARAHGAGVTVIAERVDTDAAAAFCAAHGVLLLQGPLFRRDAAPSATEFSTSELQCLTLTALLSADELDQGRVIRVIASDPELTMRVLRLVNSGAYGVRHRIDSVRRAVVMLGPLPLITLAMASLVGSRGHATTGLWFMLTRAVACRTLVGNDAAYTVGLLSAAAAQLRVAPADLVARTGVSDDVGDALLSLSGPYGPVLAAVLAHEENDIPGVEATGLAPADVARAFLDALAEARTTAEDLAG